VLLPGSESTFQAQLVPMQRLLCISKVEGRPYVLNGWRCPELLGNVTSTGSPLWLGNTHSNVSTRDPCSCWGNTWRQLVPCHECCVEVMDGHNSTSVTYMAGCIWLYTAVYSHIQDIQKVDFCMQIIWVKRYLDEMILDDTKGTSATHQANFLYAIIFWHSKKKYKDKIT
jgi:hypothetical protein